MEAVARPRKPSHLLAEGFEDASLDTGAWLAEVEDRIAAAFDEAGGVAYGEVEACGSPFQMF